MPHHKSAVKRIRTTKRDNAKNTAARSELKTLMKKLSEAPTDKELASKAASLLDRAVKRGVIKKAVANRRKSRLALAANRVASKAS